VRWWRRQAGIDRVAAEVAQNWFGTPQPDRASGARWDAGSRDMPGPEPAGAVSRPGLRPLDRLRAVRPNDVNLGVALDIQPGKASFYRIVAGPGLEGGPGLSTLDPDIVEMHKETGWGIEELEVDVVTLESVLTEYASPGFDLLKVDVEGREAAVLASADLSYWRPRVLVVESTIPDSPEPSHDKWESLVIQAGYKLALFDGLNRFYARNSEAELLRRLSVPANVFDRWIPFTWARRLGLEP
jgi:FkbM family methyltransferase